MTPIENPPSFADVEKKYGTGDYDQGYQNTPHQEYTGPEYQGGITPIENPTPYQEYIDYQGGITQIENPPSSVQEYGPEYQGGITPLEKLPSFAEVPTFADVQKYYGMGENNHGYQNTQYQENGPPTGPCVQENQPHVGILITLIISLPINNGLGDNNQGYQNSQYQENGPATGPFVQEYQQEQQPQNQGNCDFYIC